MDLEHDQGNDAQQETDSAHDQHHLGQSRLASLARGDPQFQENRPDNRQQIHRIQKLRVHGTRPRVLEISLAQFLLSRRYGIYRHIYFPCLCRSYL